MRRREFIAGLGSAVAWPLAARAQQPAMPVIGVLNSTSPGGAARQGQMAAFRQGVNEAGYVEGRNVAIEYRSAEGQYDRLPSLAAELVRRRVSVIATIGGVPAAVAAKSATAMIPIVFEFGGDPVEMGLVASLSRPGGNITGITNLNVELGPKKLELLHEIVPKATRIALLINSGNTNRDRVVKDMQAAARALGVELIVVDARTERDIDAVFARLRNLGAQALVIGPDPFFVSTTEQFAALAVRDAVPAIFEHVRFVAAGGLMSYGGSLPEAYRLTGVYVGRVIKKPADLPVQQSTKVELFLNMKAAKALGLTIPETLLATADEVIQ
jgi:putative ABC transport system substrate-binding protein